MVHDESRPRRAWHDDDSVDASDDTAAGGASPARRGGESPDPDDSLNPFARPGSDEAAQPVPEAPLAGSADAAFETPIPAPVFPRSAGEYADSPSPAPRRSALSSTTPVEREVAAPAAPNWVADNRGRLLTWALAGLVLVLIVGLISFFVARADRPAEGPTDSSSPSLGTSASASPSPSREPAERTDLLTAEDLAGIAPAAKWAVTESTFAVADHTGRAACLSSEPSGANPTHSLQRLLATSDDDRLAALHRIDVYASASAASRVMAATVETLSACRELPVRIVRSSTVTDMADEAFQLTVVFEDVVPQFHTVLLTRAGAAVQLLDVVRNGAAVDADALAAALARPQEILCAEQDLTCGTPTITDAVIPPAEPRGWVIPSDLPRVSPGAGRWTMSTPNGVTSRGMGCENMTLATEPGPSERQQATYLMTEDPAAPGTFGMDEMVFAFGDTEAAAAFTTKLATSLATCKDRVNTAAVTELPGVAATGQDGLALSSRVFTITQATGAQPLPFQLIVSVAGNRVVYTLITVTDTYKLTDAQLAELAARVSVRASQFTS